MIIYVDVESGSRRRCQLQTSWTAANPHLLEIGAKLIIVPRFHDRHSRRVGIGRVERPAAWVDALPVDDLMAAAEVFLPLADGFPVAVEPRLPVPDYSPAFDPSLAGFAGLRCGDNRS